MWKTNYEFIRRVIHCVKGMFFNYAFALVTVLVFSQLSENTLSIYGVLLPYMLVGIALAEGMEMAIFSAASRNPGLPIARYVFLQWCLAALFCIFCVMLPRPTLLNDYDWNYIGLPLVLSYAIYIASSVFIGLLRSRFATRVIYLIHLSSLCLLIFAAVYEAVQGVLIPSRWAVTVLCIAMLEWLMLLVATLCKKWNWIGAESRSNELTTYIWYSAPLVGAWFVIAFDRYWLNHILSHWGMAYIGVLAGWFQLKPILLFPAIAIGQMLVRYVNQDVSKKASEHFKILAPSIVLFSILYLLIGVYFMMHVDGILYSFAPQLKNAIKEIHWVVFIDAITIPMFAIILVSRLFLESEQKGWAICLLLLLSIIISRGFITLTCGYDKSFPILAISFAVQAACFLSIPFYFYKSHFGKRLQVAL